MNHKKYKEWIQLYLYDELLPEEKDELLNHLDNCSECSSEFEKHKRFYQMLREKSLPRVDYDLLTEARREFNAALKVEKSKHKSLGFRMIDFSGFFFSPLKIAFAGAAVLIAGIIIGSLFFNNSDQNNIQNVIEKDNLSGLQENTQITNLRFIDQDPSDGQIEFVVDAVKPLRIKGKVNDPEIQSILTYSMLYEQNPGTRLNAINIIKSNAVQNRDEEVKTALINVAKYDTSLGVRREALKLLRNFAFDSDVRAALLYILLNDESSAMRIEAIASLKEISEKGNGFNQDEISAFRENLEKEENNYVKYQIKTAIEENIQNEK